MATFVHEGNSIDYTPGADVALGAVVVQSDLVGVAQRPIAANTLGSLAVVGVFDFPKATGTGSGVAAGASCYWKPAAGEDPAVATIDADDGGEPATAYVLIGKCIKAATDGATTARIRLSQ